MRSQAELVTQLSLTACADNDIDEAVAMTGNTAEERRRKEKRRDRDRRSDI